MATNKLPAVPDFEEILEKLDLTRIESAIVGDESLGDVDLEDARRLCMIGAQTWLPRDLVEWKINGIEERHEVTALCPIAGQNDYVANLKGFFDIRGTMNGKFPFRGEKGTDLYRFKDKTFVCDWKTSKNALDVRWRDRLVDSWQWRLYHVLCPMSVMFFRGIRRNGETRELPLEIPRQRIGTHDITTHETIIQLQGAIGQLKSWIDNQLPVLPRSMPGACAAYGRSCPRYDDCVDFEMPQQSLKVLPNISYSLLSHLALCPERLRRIIVDTIAQSRGDAEDSEASVFGQAVHRGLSEIYKQAFKIKEPNENEGIATPNTDRCGAAAKPAIYLAVCDNCKQDGDNREDIPTATPGNAPVGGS